MGGTGQDLKTEMFLTSWTDVSSFVYQRDTVTAQRGRQNEASTMQPGQAGLTLNNRDGRFTTRNPVGAYYPNLVQNTPLRLSVPVADAGLSNYLRLEGDLTSSVTTPDKAGLQITGPIDIRVDCWLTDFQPAVLAAKWGGTAKSWMFVLNAAFADFQPSPNFMGTGTLGFYWWDGSAVHGADSGAGIPGTAPQPGTGGGARLPYYGQRICVRVLFTPSTGTVQFFTAPTMAGSFTQLGNTVALGATTLANGAGQAVQVGGSITQFLPTFSIYSTTFNSALGMIYEAQILNNVTLEVDPVFSAQTAGVTSFTDSQSSLWTLNGTAEISSRLYRFHGEMGSFPKAADPSAQDVYSQAAAYGITKRLQNSNTPLQSPMRRGYVRIPASVNLGGYWPGEDGNTATSIGSAVGGTPMQITGTPTLGSNSDFACSAPLPVMAGAQFTASVSAPGVTWTGNIVRFLWECPGAGEGSGSPVVQFTTTGTAGYVSLVYTTGGNGNLNMSAFTAPNGTLLHSTGNVSTPLNGQKMRVSVELKPNGGNVDMTFATLTPGGSVTNVFTATAAFAGTIGAVSRITWGASGITGSVMGHFSVQGGVTDIFDLSGPLDAWNGEPAAVRVARLCTEESIASRIVGSPTASTPMGNQSIDTLMNLLQSCENTDLGMLSEPRQALAIGYRTRSSMYHQTPLATASYSGGQVFQGFTSTDDTQLTVNDVTATAPSGSTARQFLAAGPMSVLAPPNGIGRVDTAISPQPGADSLLNHIANWNLTVRSVNDDRYPAIPFQLARTSTPAAVPLLDVGDYLQITSPPAWLPPGPVKQLCAGFAETWFPAALWLLQVNGIPESPYETAVAGTVGTSAKADTAGSVIAAAVTSGAGTLQVAPTVAGSVWTQAAGDFPLDIAAAGEQVTVTAIGAVSQPNLFSDDFEVSVASWTPFNCTFVQSGAQHHTGSFSGLMTSVGTPSVMTVNDTVAVPVTPGAIYQAAGWMLAPVTLTACYMQLLWYNAAGVNFATTSSTPASATSTWGFFATPQTAAPAGAVTALMGFASNSPGASAQLFCDGAGLNVSSQAFTVTRSVNGVVKAQNAGTAVALYHTPIAGL